MLGVILNSNNNLHLGFQRSLSGITTPLQTQPQPNTLPSNLVSALNQLGPNDAKPILQDLQQQMNRVQQQMWNPLGSQQNPPQVPVLYSQQHHYGLYGLPHTAHVTPHSQGAYWSYPAFTASAGTLCHAIFCYRF